MKLCMLNVWESQKEKNMVFAIIEDRGDRVVIAEVNCSMPITPTELVSASDIRIVGDTCHKTEDFRDYDKGCCPKCGTENTDYEGSDGYKNFENVNYACPACKIQFSEIYQLAEVEITDII